MKLVAPRTKGLTSIACMKLKKTSFSVHLTALRMISFVSKLVLLSMCEILRSVPVVQNRVTDLLT